MCEMESDDRIESCRVVKSCRSMNRLRSHEVHPAVCPSISPGCWGAGKSALAIRRRSPRKSAIRKVSVLTAGQFLTLDRVPGSPEIIPSGRFGPSDPSSDLALVVIGHRPAPKSIAMPAPPPTEPASRSDLWAF